MLPPITPAFTAAWNPTARQQQRTDRQTDRQTVGKWQAWHLDELCDGANASPRQLRKQDHALNTVVLQQRNIRAHLRDGLNLRQGRLAGKLASVMLQRSAQMLNPLSSGVRCVVLAKDVADIDLHVTARRGRMASGCKLQGTLHCMRCMRCMHASKPRARHVEAGWYVLLRLQLRAQTTGAIEAQPH